MSEAIEELLSFLQEYGTNAPIENEQSFVVSGERWPAESARGWQAMQEVHRWLMSKNLGACSLTGENSPSTDFTAQQASIIPRDRWSFSVNKNVESGEAYFLTLTSFEDSLRRGYLSAVRTVRIYGEFQPFSTYSISFLSLDADVDTQPEPWKGEDDPRQIVRVLSEGIALPQSITSWLPFGSAPSHDGDVYCCWRGVAIEKLGLSLPHEIRKNAALEVTIKGPRKLALSVESEIPNSQELFEQIVQTVRWVYESADHLSSRHDLLIHHLVVDWGNSERWFEGLKKHLEEARRNAADSFRFYLVGETKEVLASLTDLRKAMFHEVSQVSTDVTELVGTLWKDLTLIIGAALINLIPRGNALQRPEVLYRVVICFITLHFLFRVITSWRKQRLGKQEREKWKRRLFKYIEESDYRELVDRPIARHLRTFKGVVFVLTLVYMFLGIALWNPPSFLIATPGASSVPPGQAESQQPVKGGGSTPAATKTSSLPTPGQAEQNIVTTSPAHSASQTRKE